MRRIPCNLCGERREFDEVHTDRSQDLRVVHCRGCGLIFVNPTFTPQEHLKYYNETHWSQFPASVAGSYSSFPPEQVERWEKRAKAHLDYFCQHCEKIKKCNAKDVLEVGCGYAAHLEEMKRRCPEVTLAAVEPNRRFYSTIRRRLPGVRILGRTIETIAGGRMLFDCIIAVDVIERTVDPTATLRRIYTMLHPQGLCLLITMNAAGRSGVVYDLAHLCYFTEGTLSRLVGKCHLGIVRVDVRGEMSAAGDERIYAVLKKN